MAESRDYPVLLGTLGLALYKQRPDGPELAQLQGLFEAVATAIHGEAVGQDDNRREVKDASGDAQELARSVALISPSPLQPQPDGTLKLDTRPVGLLSTQPFAQQEAVPDGYTGFLVGEDLLLTTAHGSSPVGFHVVFDYQLNGSVAKTTYAADEVFKVIKEETRNDDEDWLLLRLDHKPERPFRTIDKKQAEVGTPLWMLGHPLGLPMKFVDGAKVTQLHGAIFDCDLDASHGNSGSPVLHAAGNVVVGVLQETSAALRSMIKSKTPWGKDVWIWCLGVKGCPTKVTSSAAFESAVAQAVGS